MNIYLIYQTVNTGYDTYDSAVVVAESEEKARMMHPSGYVEDWDGSAEDWSTWCDSKDVIVELIGTSLSDKPYIACSSLNAG